MAGSTGAPWNLPYVEPSDRPSSVPETDRAQMVAVGSALTTAVKQSHAEQLADVYHRVDAGSGLAESPKYEDAKATIQLDVPSVVLLWFCMRVSSDGEIKAQLELDGQRRYVHTWVGAGDGWVTYTFMLPSYVAAGSHTVVVRVWRASGTGASWRELTDDAGDAGTRLIAVRL